MQSLQFTKHLENQKLYKMLVSILDLPSSVTKNPETSQTIFPIFQPRWIDAMKLIGIPTNAIIISANIMFISNIVKSSHAWNSTYIVNFD